MTVQIQLFLWEITNRATYSQATPTWTRQLPPPAPRGRPVWPWSTTGRRSRRRTKWCSDRSPALRQTLGEMCISSIGGPPCGTRSESLLLTRLFRGSMEICGFSRIWIKISRFNFIIFFFKALECQIAEICSIKQKSRHPLRSVPSNWHFPHFFLFFPPPSSLTPLCLLHSKGHCPTDFAPFQVLICYRSPNIWPIYILSWVDIMILIFAPYIL